MAAIRTYDDPYQERDPYRQSAGTLNDLTYKMQDGKMQPVQQNPYQTVNVPGYQPSADYQTPYAPTAPYTGGAGPYGGISGGYTAGRTNPFDINTLVSNLNQYYPTHNVTDLQRAQQEHPDWFAGGQFSGSKGDKFTYNGRIYDLLQSAGTGGAAWQGLDVTNPGSGGGASEFSDPLGALYEQTARARIEALFNPIPNGPDTTSMIDQTRKRIGELQGPAYSEKDRQVLQTQFADPLAAQRQAAKQQVVQRLAAQGIQGGIVEKAVQEVDRQYDSMLAANQRQLSENEITRGDQRQQEATSLQQYLATAEQARQAYQEGRYADAVALADRLAQMPERRLTLGNNILNGGQQPQDIFNSLMNLGQAGDQSNYYQTAQRDAYMQQVFQALARVLG